MVEKFEYEIGNESLRIQNFLILFLRFANVCLIVIVNKRLCVWKNIQYFWEPLKRGFTEKYALAENHTGGD